MKENFLPSLTKVLQYEGGYTNHPLDKGGPTNLGITLSTLKQFYDEYDYGDLDGDGDVDINDIKMLNTLELAAPIYKKYYWDKMKLDLFPSGPDFLMFDFGVNSGPRNAIKILQRSLNRYTNNAIDVDGVLGPQTMNKINNTNPKILVDSMLKERNIFYNKLISLNPSQEVFRKGWFNRLDRVSKEVQEFMS